MKTAQILAFSIPVAFIAAGFVIGNRDGAIISVVGSAALLIVSFWQAIKVVSRI